jgi:hypothetical protein
MGADGSMIGSGMSRWVLRQPRWRGCVRTPWPAAVATSASSAATERATEECIAKRVYTIRRTENVVQVDCNLGVSAGFVPQLKLNTKRRGQLYTSLPPGRRRARATQRPRGIGGAAGDAHMGRTGAQGGGAAGRVPADGADGGNRAGRCYKQQRGVAFGCRINVRRRA